MKWRRKGTKWLTNGRIGFLMESETLRRAIAAIAISLLFSLSFGMQSLLFRGSWCEWVGGDIWFVKYIGGCYRSESALVTCQWKLALRDIPTISLIDTVSFSNFLLVFKFVLFVSQQILVYQLSIVTLTS